MDKFPIPPNAYRPTKEKREVVSCQRSRLEFVRDTDDGFEYIPICEFDSPDDALNFAKSIRTYERIRISVIRIVDVKQILIESKVDDYVAKKPIISHTIDEENQHIAFTVDMNWTTGHQAYIDSEIYKQIMELTKDKPYRISKTVITHSQKDDEIIKAYKC